MTLSVFPIRAAWERALARSVRIMARAIVPTRAALFGYVALAAGVAPVACATAQQVPVDAGRADDRAASDEGPANDGTSRRVVSFHTGEAPGTIVIDTKDRVLYLVQSNDRAIRYGIGVGRDGFRWSGQERISRKEEWPDWRPPPAMIGRQPYLPRFMAGGDGNPMGARALYLGSTVFRIHGTNQPQTIGHAVSSGCFRLANEDVVDLYDRVQLGAKVIVMQDVAPQSVVWNRAPVVGAL